jgi:hypothetical protein
VLRLLYQKITDEVHMPTLCFSFPESSASSRIWRPF